MPDESYKGQARIPDAGGDFNELAFVFRQLSSALATSQPVLVQAVGADGLTVDVQPMVAQIDGEGNATPHGVIHNVPVLRVQGGTNGIIVDPVAGDIGMAVIANRDISSVKANRAPSNPGSRRQFDWADAIYIPGILNLTPMQFVRVGGAGIALEAPLVTASDSMQVGAGATGVITDITGRVATFVKGILVELA
jgi:hypothetical protein